MHSGRGAPYKGEPAAAPGAREDAGAHVHRALVAGGAPGNVAGT